MFGNLFKMFTKDRVLLLLAFGAFVWFLVWYSSDKYSFVDSMDTGSGAISTPGIAAAAASTNDYTPVMEPGPPPSVGQQPVTDPKDLLPKDSNSQWANLNPVQSQGMPDLLQAGSHYGIDSIGQSMRNANLQLRSDPYIPINDNISPWNNSTIEPSGLVQHQRGVDIGN